MKTIAILLTTLALAIPLHAAEEKVFEIIVSKDASTLKKYLQEHPDAIRTKTKRSQLFPMHIAARKGSVPMLKALFAVGGDVNATDDIGTRPIDVAAGYEKQKAVDYLKSIGATEPDRTRVTCMREARKQNALQALLQWEIEQAKEMEARGIKYEPEPCSIM